MKTTQVTCINDVGLHARPAAQFVKTANRFQSSIQIRNVSTTSDQVNAKSILRVLSIGVEQNHMVEISAEGEDEELAVQSLETLIRSGFDEQA